MSETSNDNRPNSSPDDWINPVASLTEDKAATEFTRIYAGRLAYCHSQGKWFEFDGAIWRPNVTQRAFHYARLLCRKLSDSTENPTSFQKARFSQAVEAFARADTAMAKQASDWNRDHWLLGTPSGTVDLRTGRHRPSNPTDYITRAVTVEPTPYEPDGAFCPVWREFLRSATGGNDELIRFLQQIAGYALTGDTREQALFFIYGPGGNGKGVFLNTITEILGDYAKTAAMSTFEESRNSSIPTDLAMLDGARLVAASETEASKTWSQQRITSMTGGDPITARFMREDFFTYIPQFKLIIIGNHEPLLRTVDDAIRRRFNIIPFTIKPATPDLQLREKLKAEYPAILRWMIDGCMDWQKNGLIRPETVKQATQEYFRDQDVFTQWCEECCEVDLDNKAIAAGATPLFHSWSEFCRTHGEESGTAKNFATILRNYGIIKERTRTGVLYRGIRLNGRPSDF